MSKCTLIPFIIFFVSVGWLTSCNSSVDNSATENRSDTCINATRSSDISNADTSLRLELRNDSAFFLKGGKLLESTYLQPLKMIGGDSLNPKEICDQAYLLANSMVVLRSIRSAGHFCHVPEVASVEIHTLKNGKKVIKQGNQKSTVLMGMDITSIFNGGAINAPDGQWGIVLIEAEGELYGFLLLKADASYSEVVFKEAVSNQQVLKMIPSEGNCMSLSAVIVNDTLSVLTVCSDGSYSFSKSK